MTLIRLQNALAKFLLMQPLLDDPRRISPPDVRLNWIELNVSECRKALLVHRNRKRQTRAIVANDKDRVLRRVPAGDDSVKVHQRQAQPHRFSKTDVVWMVRGRSIIGAAIAIAKSSVLAKCIVVWTVLAFSDGYGCNAERIFTDSWFENALRPHQRHALTVEGEASAEYVARKEIRAESTLLVEKSKGGEPYGEVAIAHGWAIVASVQGRRRQVHHLDVSGVTLKL